MNINNFLKLPIVKIVVTVLFIYFIYDKTKDNPRSISYHIKKENFDKAGEVIKFGVQKAYESKELDSNNDIDNIENIYSKNSPLKFFDLRIGEGLNQVECGHEVEIEYSLITKSSEDIYNKSNIKFFVGDGFNSLIQRGIIGMKIGGVRLIDIPKNFKTGDNQYDSLIASKEMVYKILLLSIGANKKEGFICE